MERLKAGISGPSDTRGELPLDLINILIELTHVQEKDKVEAGGSDKRLQDLYADREQHKAEVETLTGYIKAGRGLNLLDQEGIRRLISNLYALKLTGPDLEKVAKEFKEIQDSTHGGGESGKEKKRRGSTAQSRSRSRRGSAVHFDVP